MENESKTRHKERDNHYPAPAYAFETARQPRVWFVEIGSCGYYSASASQLLSNSCFWTAWLRYSYVY